MKDAELQQTQGKRSNAGEIEVEQPLVEMGEWADQPHKKWTNEDPEGVRKLQDHG